MSGPAKAEKPTPPKAVAAKPKSTAPLPKKPGQSQATPALATLRRALGELIVGYKSRKTHMFAILANNLRSALDAALKWRHVATEAERRDLEGVEGKVQIYKNGQRVSATDVVLDKAIEAFTKEFGHPPDTLPGSLAWDNQFNFQVEYAKATMRGLPHDAACQAAIREISFGRSRAERGYDHFTVKADNFVERKLGDLGTRRVPSSISITARRSK